MSIVCNKCGKVFDTWDKHEGLKIYKTMGYGTRFDGESLEFDICIKCMEDIIASCAISPIA